MNEKNNNSRLEIKQVINQPYKYGFNTDIESEAFPKGINENIIRLIHKKKNEPEFMLKFRLNAFYKWLKMTQPNWANLEIKNIDFDQITYYSIPKQKKKLNSLDEVDPEILKTFEN